MPDTAPKIVWQTDGYIGRIYIGGKYWAAVEWSEKRQAWCVEDAEGRRLAHKHHIHGQAAAKEEAVALAVAMIADGRIPSPQQAREARDRRRERQRQQPAQLRRAAEREEEMRAFRAEWDAKRRENAEQPLWEVLHETFDFADPDLWKSNSFAALRPRLIIHIEAVIAGLEHDVLNVRRSRYGAQERIAGVQAKLARAREVLAILVGYAN